MEALVSQLLAAVVVLEAVVQVALKELMELPVLLTQAEVVVDAEEPQ